MNSLLELPCCQIILYLSFKCLCCRIGHHSTSDDSSAYRSVDEVRLWDSTQHPIARLRAYMVHQNYWDEAKEKQWKDDCKRQVMQSFARAERRQKPSWKEMFTDVYDDMPQHLQ
ncbi:2-oxoisovalerate dehydrogenase subunit alpha, mitochondrial [Portunus trituberculatus]|uniref:2-oxoisovalerate dehydrogenase subunit alpha n=1 Tax=Portunus trituberculatus TaxID=210409 RepID=A0A5B7JFH4_PORTR|nr:2-oxoisovalerate dehydrogenase subunit alpha, mitochondrial [Portunus trituberculatus]